MAAETFLPYQLLSYFEQAIFLISNGLEDFGPTFKPDLRIADPRHGDFQINGVLPWAKRQGKNPRAVGEALAEALRQNTTFSGDTVSLEVAGPGFINLKLSDSFVLEWVFQYSRPAALKAAAHKRLENQTIVIDYSSPNTAKQMHVGHLRSMVIGEAIQRLLRFFGAKVIRDNHLGDWGTQFGILLMEIKAQNYDLDASHADALEDLERIYKEGSARFKESTEAQQIARQELVKLQQGDPENFALWEKITQVSFRAFEAIYRSFGVEFDQIQGESFYRDKLERVFEELKATGIAESSEGALVVFHREHPRFNE
ncbi:MAG TPA: arginine--tRNA ligase, partial [Opitutales bacterium]|nr:arginine--tRNA ligase [Opitutales bacterium]